MTRSTLDTGICRSHPHDPPCKFCKRSECPGCIICTLCDGVDPVDCLQCEGAVMISPILPNGRRIDA